MYMGDGEDEEEEDEEEDEEWEEEDLLVAKLAKISSQMEGSKLACVHVPSIFWENINIMKQKTVEILARFLSFQISYIQQGCSVEHRWVNLKENYKLIWSVWLYSIQTKGWW